MNRNIHVIALLSCAMFYTTGCAIHRGNVTALSQEQQQYYKTLDDTLKKQRQTLAIALEEQLTVDRTRQQNLLDWQRDLEKAEVLLQRDPNVTGADRLLHMKLAELDLESVDRVAALRKIDESREQAILHLYDQVIVTLESLQKNSTTLVNYLDSKDAVYALKSLDVEGMFRAAAAIRQGSEELGYITKASDEEAKTQREQAQQAIEKVRALLIKVFQK
jgi:hypothetical protein